MQQERNYLIKKVFPDIERECRRRNVEFTPLDLRWGITEEEASSGKVIEICMDEIARTRPFFIGLVGGRYGWIPGGDEQGVDLERLAARYPWIEPYIRERRSITEMEMLYGVLDNPEPVEAHFFLRRDLAVPRRYRETDPEGKAKRAMLKERIREAADQGRCTADDYGSVASLGKAVHQRLMEMIDRLYPLEEIPDIYDLYAAEQERKLRELRQVYTPCYSELPGLRTAVYSSGDIDIVCGPPGSGLSALLANQIGEMLADDEEDETYEVIHTIVDENVATQELLRRMFLHSLRRLYPEVEVPELTQSVDGEIPFREILGRFPKKPFLWIIDGAEKMADAGERNLGKIINDAEAVGRIVVACSDRATVEGIRAACPGITYVHNIESIASPHIREITADYLRHYSKGLSERQMTAISNSPVFATQKMLRAFLDKLVTFGIFEDVDAFIHSFATLDSEEQFYDRLLQYLGEEFGEETVGELFRRLECSAIGMSEEGLFRGISRNPLEKAALLAAIAPYTIRSHRNIQLAPGPFVSAVGVRYPVSEKDSRRLARMIIDDCRKNIRSCADKSAENRVFGLVARLLLRGIPSYTDETRLMYQTLYFSEIIRQELKLGKTRKVAKRLKHYSMMRLINIISPSKAMLPELRKVVKRPGRMFDSYDIIMGYLIMDGAHVIPLLWSKFPADDKEKELFVRDIRRKWLPRKIRESLYAQLRIGGGSKDLIDLWNEDDVAAGEMADLVELNDQCVFLLANTDEDYVGKLYDKIRRTLEKNVPEEYSLIIYKTAAMASLRLRRHDDLDRHIRSIRQLPFSNAVESDIEFLLLFRKTMFRIVEADEAVKLWTEFLDRLTSLGVNDTLYVHAGRIIRDYYRSEALGSRGEITPELRSVASFVPPGSILSAAGKGAEAVAVAREGLADDRKGMALPAFRAILERELEPGVRIHYLYELARNLIYVEDYDSALEAIDEGIRLLSGPEVKTLDVGLWNMLVQKIAVYERTRDLEQAFATAKQLLEVSESSGSGFRVIIALNRLANTASAIADRMEEGSEQWLGQMRVVLDFEEKAYASEPSDKILWHNLVNNTLKLDAFEPAEERLEALCAEGERFLAAANLNNDASIIATFSKLFQRLGKNGQLRELVLAHPDRLHFERRTQNYRILMENNPSEREIRNYALHVLQIAELTLRNMIPPVRYRADMAATMADIIEAGLAPEAIRTAEERLQAREVDFITGCVALGLATLTDDGETASRLDERLARMLAEKSPGEKCYCAYAFMRQILDGVPFAEGGDAAGIAAACRIAVIDRFAGGSEQRRRLFIDTVSACSDGAAARRAVDLALKLDGPGSATLPDIARRFCEEIPFNTEKCLDPFSKFVDELLKNVKKGTEFPRELCRKVGEGMEHMAYELYRQERSVNLQTWESFETFLRKTRVPLGSYMTVDGILLNKPERRAELLQEYVVNHGKEVVEKDVFISYYWAMRGDGMTEKADGFLDFMLERIDREDEQWPDMMSEKAYRQRRLGDYSGALEIYRMVDSYAEERCGDASDYFHPLFPLMTMLLAGEYDGFERQLEASSASASEREIALYRCIYCLKVDNLTTAEKIYSGLPELEPVLPQGEDVDPEEEALARSHIALEAYRQLELARYWRRHGHEAPAVEALEESSRLLEIINGEYDYLGMELRKELDAAPSAKM